MGPSGISMPVGDITGWSQIFTDDFSTSVPLGSWPQNVSSKWMAYGDAQHTGYMDTSGNGTYDTAQTISQSGDVLDLFLHTASGIHYVAGPIPKLPGGTGDGNSNQRYGRYAVCWRADVAPGYKTAWLLWPQVDPANCNGEVDFPEANLDGSDTVSAFMHWQTASSCSDQDAYSTSTVEAGTGWHVSVVEWSATEVKFILDGVTVGTSTTRIPNTPEHWVLQTETRLSGGPPASNVSGHVQIDWVAVYAPETIYTVPGSIAHDGSVNVTSDLLAFIATVPDNGTIRFQPGGLYRVDGVLQVTGREGLRIDGNGSTFQQVTDGTELSPSLARTRCAWSFTSCSNIKLTNMTVQGANPNAGISGPAYVASLEAQHAYSFLGCSNVMVDTCQAYDMYGDFIYIGASNEGSINSVISDHVTVQNCTFDRNGRQAFSVIGGTDILLDNNSVSNIRRTLLDIEPNSTRDTSRRVTLSNNTIGPHASGFYFLSRGGQAADVGDITIDSNTCLPGGSTLQMFIAAPASTRDDHYTITNNVTSSAFGTTTPQGVMHFNNVDHLVVSGNTPPGQLNRGMSGVAVRDCTGVSITNNTFTNCGSAVYVFSGAIPSPVTGNTPNNLILQPAGSPVSAVPPLVTVTGGATANPSEDVGGCILSCSQGTWSNSPTSFAYQWQRSYGGNVVDIEGATQQGYTTNHFDYGYQLVCVVTASNASGSGTVSSGPSATLGAQVAPPLAVPTVNFNPIPYGLIQYNNNLDPNFTLLTASQNFITQQLDGMKAAGATWVRADILWNVLQPSIPTGADKSDPNDPLNHYNWSALDVLVFLVTNAGLNLLGVFYNCPGWALPVQVAPAPKPEYPPAQYNDYANFLTAAVRHLGTSIAAYEIWDSPNVKSGWNQDPALGYPMPASGIPGCDPVTYTSMLTQSYNRMIAANPAITVISGGMSPAVDAGGSLSPVTFMARCYDNGVRGKFSAIGLKPFTNPAPPLETVSTNTFYQARKVFETAVQRGESPRLKIWATSAGFTTYTGTQTHDGNTPEVQAQFVGELMRGWAAYPFAGPLFYYHYQDSVAANQPGAATAFYGIVDSAATPKQSFATFQGIAATPDFSDGRRMGMTIDSLIAHVGQPTVVGGGNGADLAQQEINAVFQAGASVIRFELNWSLVAPTAPAVGVSYKDPAYRWGAVDSIYAYAAANRMVVIPCIVYTPSWAGPVLNGPPTNMVDYGNFCAAVTDRYSTLRPGVTLAIEIWNEPNNVKYWAPGPNPASYAAMLKQAHDSIKFTNRQMFVLAGGLNPEHWNKVSPSDTGHGSDVQIVSKVGANVAPTITWQHPTAAEQPVSGTTSTLDVNVTDPDSPLPASVSYSIALPGGPSALGTAPSPGYILNWNTKNVANGTYAITASTVDSVTAAPASATLNVTVNNPVPVNQPPTITWLHPTASEQPVSGTSSQLDVSVTDPDSPLPSSVDYVLHRTDGTTLAIGTAASGALGYALNWNTKQVGDGTYTIDAIAIDTISGQKVTTSTSVKIQNNVAPTITWVHPAPSEQPVSGTASTLAINVTDPDSPVPTSADYVLHRPDGSTLALGTAPSPSLGYAHTWNTQSVVDGTYTINAIVRDTTTGVVVSTPTTVQVRNALVVPLPAKAVGMNMAPWVNWEPATGANNWSAATATMFNNFLDQLVKPVASGGLGQKWLRIGLWRDNFRTAVEWDGIASACAAHGVNIIAQIDINPLTNAAVDNWVDKCLAYPSVKMLEFGNEMNAGNRAPDYAGFAGHPGPADYAVMMRRVFVRARGINPNIPVLIGGVTYHNSDDTANGTAAYQPPPAGVHADVWLQRLCAAITANPALKVNGQFPWDGACVHPYSDIFNTQSSPTDVARFGGGVGLTHLCHSALVNAGAPGNLVGTEFGSRADGAGYDANAFNFGKLMLDDWFGLSYTSVFCWFDLGGLTQDTAHVEEKMMGIIPPSNGSAAGIATAVNRAKTATGATTDNRPYYGLLQQYPT